MFPYQVTEEQENKIIFLHFYGSCFVFLTVYDNKYLNIKPHECPLVADHSIGPTSCPSVRQQSYEAGQREKMELQAAGPTADHCC